MSKPCETCKHYRPPRQTELVGYCRRVSPQVVTWEERTEGKCGHDGALHEERQPGLFTTATLGILNGGT